MILLVGCSSVPVHTTFHMPGIDENNPGNLTWPALPEVPRYAFIGHLYGESNTNGEESDDGVLARVFAAIVGLGAKKKIDTRSGETTTGFQRRQWQAICDGSGAAVDFCF
jgi:hypothetical protein